MIKRLCTVMGMSLLLAAAVHAGDKHAKSASTDKAADMKAIQAEMMKCSVCKPMAAKMDVLGPAMKTEFVKLNDGMAIMHEVTDPAVMPTFRSTMAEMHKAGEACKSYTPEQAKTQLCSMCQEIHGLMTSGAHMSMGDTKNGNMMVLTATDPAVQTKISSMQMKCQEMMGM
jgi:hypothetical protein